MGNSSASPSRANPPEGIIKVNDSVWEFQSGPKVPSVVIIFFHGLQLGDYVDAFWKTWLVRDDERLVWPKVWLGPMFPNARILSVSYNSSATASKGPTDMYLLGESLVTDIIHHRSRIGQESPVILVGHSLGGITIKQFILSAQEAKGRLNRNTQQAELVKIQKFLDNFKAVLYYGTPHQGSKIADYAKYLPGGSSYLKLLKTLDVETSRINSNFRIRRVNDNILASAVCEGRATGYKAFPAIFVVPEASARSDIDWFYTSTESDHFNVCRPSSQTDNIFEQLVELVGRVLSVGTGTQIPEEGVDDIT